MADSAGIETKIRVLHIDDDPEFGDLTATYLERTDGGLSVKSVTDVEDAMEHLETGAFDCVVSDYDMPDQNGIEFLETVRETYPNLPFVLFTGKGTEAIASEAISAGVSDYLQKSPGSEQYELLANRIQNLVEKSRASADLEGRLHQQQIVRELIQSAITTDEIQGLFERAVNSATDALDISHAKVLQLQPEADQFLFRGAEGWDDDYVGTATVSADGKPRQAIRSVPTVQLL